MSLVLIAVAGISGAGAGLLISKGVNKIMPGGGCPILCNPKISAGYFALMGMMMAAN